MWLWSLCRSLISRHSANFPRAISSDEECRRPGWHKLGHSWRVPDTRPVYPFCSILASTSRQKWNNIGHFWRLSKICEKMTHFCAILAIKFSPRMTIVVPFSRSKKIIFCHFLGISRVNTIRPKCINMVIFLPTNIFQILSKLIFYYEYNL